MTAVSLKRKTELEKDALVINDLHVAGQMSDQNYKELRKMIAKALEGDWSSAEKQAYEFRARFGDDGSYFT